MRGLVLLLILSTGCLIVPKATTKTRVVGTHTKVVPLAAGALAVRAQSQDAIVRVFAALPRSCQRMQVDRLEVTHGKTSELAVDIGNDPRGALLALLLAPITLPVSGLITSAVIHGHDDTVTENEQTTMLDASPCPLLANHRIELTLPSGAVARIATADNGIATYPVPAEEPDHGRITVHTSDDRRLVVEYYRSFASCDAQRLARFSVAATGAELERLPRCGAVTLAADPARERTWDTAIAAAYAATKRRCPSRAQLDAVSGQPDIHAALLGRIEACTARPRAPVVHGNRSACLVARREALREAHEIIDVQARGEALLRIPHCD